MVAMVTEVLFLNKYQLAVGFSFAEDKHDLIYCQSADNEERRHDVVSKHIIIFVFTVGALALADSWLDMSVQDLLLSVFWILSLPNSTQSHFSTVFSQRHESLRSERDSGRLWRKYLSVFTSSSVRWVDTRRPKRADRKVFISRTSTYEKWPPKGLVLYTTKWFINNSVPLFAHMRSERTVQALDDTTPDNNSKYNKHSN